MWLFFIPVWALSCSSFSRTSGAFSYALAISDLVWPEKKLAAQAAAKAVKLRKGDYLRVYSLATAVLRQALEDGRTEFRLQVFGK